MRFSLRLLAGIAVIGVAVSLPRQASAQAAFTGTAIGNQGDFTGSIGQYFNTSSSLLINALGAFDSGNNGFAVGTTINVAIFERLSQAIIPGLSATFTNASPGTLAGGSWSYKFLGSPVALPAGQYAVVSWGFNNSDKDFNFSLAGGGFPFTLNTFSGTVSYNSIAYGAANAFPTNTLPNTGGYSAGSFIANAPEPGTLALLGFGMVAGVIARRRRA